MKQSIRIKSLDLARLAASSLESLMLLVLGVRLLVTGVTELGTALLISLGLGLVMLMLRTRLFTSASPDILTLYSFMVSGPCAIIQVILTLTSEREHEDSLFWFLLQIFSLLASFLSLLLTSNGFSQEPGPWPRRLAHILFLTSGAGSRVLLTSILVSVSPVTGLLCLLASLALHTGGHLALGDSSLSPFLGWANLFIPLGHNYGVCPNTEKLPSLSEAERVKINEAGLLERLKR